MTATLLVQIAAKATLVLLVGWGLTRVMARASAASRHLIWVLALAAALAVPAMHLGGPVWTLAVLPTPPAAGITSTEDAAPAGVASFATVGADNASAVQSADREADDTAVAAAAIATNPGDVPEAGGREPAPALGWGAILVRIWLVGVAVMLLRLAIGIAWVSVTVHQADDLPHTGWLDSLDEAAVALGLSRPVGLRISERAAVPMATGLWRAVVLLPPSAIDWPEERRRVVLQHELAHVKRRDCLMQALAQGVCAVHWFNPAAYIAVSRLRAEQERACDDLVIQVGTDARSYADHLLAIALSFRDTQFPTWVAMSMARPSQLEGRMLAILDSARARCAPSVATRALLFAATVTLALPLGALRLAAQSTAPAGAAIDATNTRSTDTLTEPSAAGTSPQALNQAGAPDASVDIVRGDLADLELLAVPSALTGGDAVWAGARRDSDRDAERNAEWVTEAAAMDKAITDLTNHATRLRAQAGGAGQTGNAVSDETRKRVADALSSALGDDNAEVRQEALSSLASMRDERAIPGLIRALSDSSAEVRMRAIGALMQFNTSAAADGLLTALKDRSPDVREQAARHLASLVSRGQVRDPKYMEAFSALLRDDNADVREQAVIALGRMRVATASGPLTQALKDSSPDVREQAARALGQLGNADAVPALSALLKDPSKDVREQAAQALGNLADPRAIDALTAALKDADPSVREEVARALGQIARGQRRGARPGVPVPPAPPLPPRAFRIDEDQIREMTERAQAAAERAQRDVERNLRNMDLRFDRFVVPNPPDPAPAPAPLPAPPR